MERLWCRLKTIAKSAVVAAAPQHIAAVRGNEISVAIRICIRNGEAPPPTIYLGRFLECVISLLRCRARVPAQ
ncbi:hypothetical protein EVAR_38125_1 [Eumeta japonica]|uniref:Uncharacterized protein n=1 Tax=Eumeta variegata TaxID=151549 RepID=A0A4C1X8J9_EUMVA|nr:hypothetical protein EVAR_38125_1 [Eumeta japonica]